MNLSMDSSTLHHFVQGALCEDWWAPIPAPGLRALAPSVRDEHRRRGRHGHSVGEREQDGVDTDEPQLGSLVPGTRMSQRNSLPTPPDRPSSPTTLPLPLGK